MNSRLIGLVGVIWGGLIIANWWMNGMLFETAVLGSRHFSSAVVGVILFAVGALYLAQKPKE